MVSSGASTRHGGERDEREEGPGRDETLVRTRMKVVRAKKSRTAFGVWQATRTSADRL